MKVGDMVKFKYSRVRDHAVGLIVEIRNGAKYGGHRIGVLWSGVGWGVMDGKIGWQSKDDIEVIDERR